METAQNVSINNVCHDCKKEISINGEKIENGVYLAYEHNGEKINAFKCNDCYAKNPALTNFQKCEVYSRVVGYIRPVAQWNNGKKQEYGERTEYVMPSGGSCGC
jgi:ribonucleoside-triphosphate reductase